MKIIRKHNKHIVMLGRIIFCTAVTLATIAVIVLAVVSPVSHKKNNSRTWLDLSLYIQQPQISTKTSNNVGKEDGAALVFRRVLTEGPEKSSRVVGRAEGFVIPTEQFAFDVIYLSSDDGPHHSGSISVQAHKDKDNDEFKVIGGTGSFAFARGFALFTKTHSSPQTTATQLVPTYHVKLQLEFPNHSTNLPT